MSALWVVPVKFDPARPVVLECIEAIQRHHESPKILVVDSGSEDKSYFDFCFERGVKVASINNQLFGFGAHAWAFRHHPDVDFFYFIFDSLIVTGNCDRFRNRPLTVMRHWHSSEHDWGWDETTGAHLSIWGRQQLERMGVPFPESYHGVMGPMYFMDRPTCEKLDNIGYWFAQTTNKHLQCAQERIAGVTLEYIGLDVPSVSLQGGHTVHSAHYPEGYVHKIDLARD